MEPCAVTARLNALRKDFGVTGALALLTVAACAGFQITFIQPLEREAVRLDAALASQRDGRKSTASAHAPAERAGAIYKLLDTGERIDESLGRLHGIAGAAGLELRSANYRLGESKTRLERYEISLPVQGTYAQIRLFVEAALRELPSLSLDRATLRRKSAADTRIDAELVLTLHRLRQ